ncbi:MAG TPA: sulfatase-like hydrolase/transferase [Actinomycetota bacterium]
MTAVGATGRDGANGEERPAGRASRRRGSHRRPRRPLVIHPLLFAAFPIVFLWAHNLSEGITFSDVVRPLAIVVGAAAGLWLVGTLVLRSARRAGLAVSILVLLFFSYGDFYAAIHSWHVAGTHVSVVLMPLWIAIAVAGVALAVRGGAWLATTTTSLNVVAAALVAVNVVSIVVFQVQSNANTQYLEAGDVHLSHRLLANPPPHRPDVYYIILDEYAGAGALRQVFHYDNSPFLDFLQRKGFYVAANSFTNYPRTELSVASSLNMKYLDVLTKQFGPNTGNTEPMAKMLQFNQVGRVMKSLGYRYIQIGSWWEPTASSPEANVNLQYGGTSEFNQLLAGTTAVSQLTDNTFRLKEYHRVLFQFRALTQLQHLRGPRFVFAHILCPHDPIVFQRNGAYLTTDEEEEHSESYNYVNQLIYTNEAVEKAVDALLSRPPERQPVIVIQSDEGPYPGEPTSWSASPNPITLEQKFDILNAYYLPGLERTGLYPTVTPVNTFRVILDSYFGAQLPLLPDREYTFVNLKTHVYDFRDVTDLLRADSAVESPSPAAGGSPSPAASPP